MFKKMNNACDRFEERVYQSPALMILCTFITVAFFWAGSWFVAAIVT